MNTIDLARLAERGLQPQRFWAIVLLLAIKDGATKVWYDPTRGDDQLGYEIDGVEYAMVPLPAAVQAALTLAISRLLRRRSLWGFIAEFLGGRRTTSAGAFLAKVGEHGIPVSATVDRSRSTVLLSLVQEGRAADAARVALERILAHSRTQGAQM